MIEVSEISELLVSGVSRPSAGYLLTLEVRPNDGHKARRGEGTIWLVDYSGRVVPPRYALSRHGNKSLAVRAMIRRLQKFDSQYSEEAIAARKRRTDRARPRLDEVAKGG